MARIAVDAMGGDFAPGPIVEGAVSAAGDCESIKSILLVGSPAAIEKVLADHPSVPSCIRIVEATEVVGMHESPAGAVRRKKDSSISRAVDLVKNGEADAVFSAGNTGAAVAATTLKLRTLEGVTRPAIAAIFPTNRKPFVMLDAGANPDASAEMVCQFAAMGAVCCQEVLGAGNPVIGLLSIGEEDAKGNDVTKAAFDLLQRSGLNFVGNVESSDLFEGKVDVAVCDGFVGNVVLKTSESVARSLGQWVKEEIEKKLIYKAGAALCRGAFDAIKQRADPAVYGGAPLLGVNGVCIIGHGSSSSKAVGNALRVAAEFVEHGINPKIAESVRKSSEALANG